MLIEAAHIYPFSLGSHEGGKNHASFWTTLETFWSEEKIEAWKKAVMGDAGTENVQNLLCLTNWAHGLWGKAYFALKPLELSDDKKTLKLKFFWLKQSKYSRVTSPSEAPDLPAGLSGIEPKQAKLWNAPWEKKVCSGDIIILTTNDPARRPLPSIDILDMQWTLNRLVAMSGVADIDDSEIEDDDYFPSAVDWWDKYERGEEPADYKTPEHESFG